MAAGCHESGVGSLPKPHGSSLIRMAAAKSRPPCKCSATSRSGFFWRDGYNALAALDEDSDGVLRGAELRGLALWHDGNGNGVSEPGEVRPLEAFGITAISCKSETHPNGIQWNSRGVVMRDGTTRPTYDWIAPSHPVEINR